MSDLKQVERIMLAYGFENFKWTSGKEIQIKHWVRFKCQFCCESVGTKESCPEKKPTIQESREFFNEYDNILVLRIPESLKNHSEREEWTSKKNLDLLKLENATLAAGFHKTFLLFLDGCRFNSEISNKSNDQVNSKFSRPFPEALGIDVIGTIKKLGFPVPNLASDEKEVNRYAFLLVS